MATYMRTFGGPNIREEACLRTACGCEKLVSVPGDASVFQQRMQIDPPFARDISWTKSPPDVMYMIRRFTYEGEQDGQGRRVFRERLERDNWKEKYRELYTDIYGMDKGL